MYLPGGAFFGAVSLLSFAVFEFVVVGFPLLDEDLKAATAISQKKKKNTQLSIKMQRQKEGIFSLNLNLRERDTVGAIACFVGISPQAAALHTRLPVVVLRSVKT